MDDDNSKNVSLPRRLDREQSGGQHTLTVKCFRPYERNVKSRGKKYDSSVIILSDWKESDNSIHYLT